MAHVPNAFEVFCCEEFVTSQKEDYLIEVLLFFYLLNIHFF